jgi:cell shape-determining protein MreC
MLPSDDDDDYSSKIKSPTRNFYAQASFRKANLAALLFVGAAFFIYLLDSGFKLSSPQALKPSSSQALNNRLAVMQPNNRGLITDQVLALQVENERLGQRLDSVQQDQVIALQTENERLHQRLELVQQSNVRRGDDKPAAVVASVTSLYSC